MVVWLHRSRPNVVVTRRWGLFRLARHRPDNWIVSTGFAPFDRAFQVNTPDPAILAAVLTSALMAAHIAGEVSDWSLVGNELLAHRTGRISDPAGIPELLAPLLRIADLIEPGAF